MLRYNTLLSVFALSLAAAMATLLLTPSFAADKGDASAVLPANYGFAMLRKGKKIGEHKIRFSNDGEKIIVDIDISIRVGLGPVTFYKYKHTNREVWDGESLLEIATETNDNGDKFTLVGKRSGVGFEILIGEEPGIVDFSIVPTSYWRATQTISATQLLDTQHGKIIDVMMAETGVDETVGATKYEMTGELELHVWYAADRIRKMAFDGGGTLIEYIPLETSGDDS